MKVLVTDRMMPPTFVTRTREHGDRAANFGKHDRPSHDRASTQAGIRRELTEVEPAALPAHEKAGDKANCGARESSLLVVNNHVRSLLV